MKLQVARAKPGEKGVALILALFALLLISAVGVAIVFMSSGETSLAANERSYTQAWEYAKDGLEEARARLSPSDNNYLGAANIPPDACHVLYIENPGPGEAALYFPANAAPTGKYADTEYASEWGAPLPAPPPPCAAMTITTVNSDMQSIPVADLPAIPAYKWVRITVKTEKSAQEDVDQDGSLDLTNTPISWDGFDQRECGPASLSPPCPSSPPPADTIVYRATALAVLPNGTTRMAQYDLKPGTPIPSLPGALTLCSGSLVSPGINITFPISTSNNFQISGFDSAPSNPQPALPGIADCGGPTQTRLDPLQCTAPGVSPCIWKYVNCTPTPSPPASNPFAPSGNTNVVGAGGCSGKPGAVPAPPRTPANTLDGPSIVDASNIVNPCLTSYSCLTSLVATIEAEADAVNPQPYPNPSGLACTLGTATAPQITVYTGDPNCGGGTDGYGILLATSNDPSLPALTFVGNAKFNGIVLVIGNGNYKMDGSACFNGGTFVANISGGTLGTPTVWWKGGGICAAGYNSLDISLANKRFAYKVLAAREINF